MNGSKKSVENCDKVVYSFSHLLLSNGTKTVITCFIKSARTWIGSCDKEKGNATLVRGAKEEEEILSWMYILSYTWVVAKCHRPQFWNPLYRKKVQEKYTTFEGSRGTTHRCCLILFASVVKTFWIHICLNWNSQIKSFYYNIMEK